MNAPPIASPDPSLPAEKPRLVIVDDSPYQLADFAYAYGKLGYAVTSVLAVPPEVKQRVTGSERFIAGNLDEAQPEAVQWRGFECLASDPQDVAHLLGRIKPKALLTDWELGDGFARGGQDILALPEARAVPVRILHSGAVPHHTKFGWGAQAEARKGGYALLAKAEQDRVAELLASGLDGPRRF